MNLLDIASTVTMTVELEREAIVNADTAELTLMLKPSVFEEYKGHILQQHTIYDVFDLTVDGVKPLLDLANYDLFQYKVTEQL